MNTKMEDAALGYWLMPHESFTVPTRYGHTYVVASGPKDAPPFVLIPAMGITSAMWMPNIAALSRDYRTYCVDTIGDLGRSTLYNSEQYPKNGQAYSEWLLEVFDEIGIEQAHVIDSSMGGWITMNHAIHASDRVKCIVLLGPMGLPSWWTTLKVMSHLWSVLLFPTQANIDQTIRWALGDNPLARDVFADFMRSGVNKRPESDWPLRLTFPPTNFER